jgi:hypothetical protein
MKYIILIIAVFLMGFLFSKFISTPEPEKFIVSKPVYNVQRILMHKTDYYTILAKEPNSNKLYSIYLSNRYDGIERIALYADVPADKEMWLNFKYSISNLKDTAKLNINSNFETVEIHMHSGKDMNGGSWTESNGKTSTNGETIPVE